MKNWKSRILYTLFFLETIILAGDIYSRIVPGEGLLGFGFNLLDMIVLSGAIGLVLIFGMMVWAPSFRNLIEERIQKVLADDKLWVIVLIGFALVVYETFQDILFFQADLEVIHYQEYRSFLGRFFSMLCWMFVSGLQVLFGICAIKWSLIKTFLGKVFRNKAFWGSIIIGLFVIGLSMSGFGNIFASEQDFGFYELPVPLLGIQVIVFTVVFFLFYILVEQLKNKWYWLRKLKSDWIILGLIGLLSFFAWISVPFGASTFIDIQRPPDVEYYPISDALYYEQGAHQILAGNGIMESTHTGFFVHLSVLHLLTGNSFQDILPLQLAILSLIPVILYKITSTIHTRISGIVVSLLYVIKTKNSLFLGEHLTVASAGDPMTEPLATLGVLIVAALMVSWLSGSKKGKLYPLLVGASAGWVILIRVEIISMLPVIGLILILFFWKDPKVFLQGGLLIVVGFVLVAGPWIAYRSISTGSPTALFLEKRGLLMRTATSDQREHITGNYGQHLANNLFQLIFYLPSNHQPLLTAGSLPDIFRQQKTVEDLEGDRFFEKYLERYIRSLPYWWKGEWTGKLVPRSIMPV